MRGNTTEGWQYINTLQLNSRFYREMREKQEQAGIEDDGLGPPEGGQAVQEVLDILDNLSVPYELLFEENDVDIKIQYNNEDYLCEIVLNDSAEIPVRNIRMKKGQRESWLAENENHGVMYYYMKTGRLEFYGVNEENELLACLKSGR